MNRLLKFFVLGLLVASCSKPESGVEIYQGEALGTTYQIKYFSDKDLNFQSSLDSIFEVINASMSTYITKSDISRINRGETGVEVDMHFKKVFEASEKIYQESNGYFDPTVGTLVNAYGFGPEDKLKEIDSTRLDSLRKLVGFEKVRLTQSNTIEKEHPGIYLDFNAIAKGYTIDVIADHLSQNGVDNFLIELGGELRAKGKNIENDASWIVGIDDPGQQAGNRTLIAKIKLENVGMATSGNYRKYRVDSVSGQQYVHTINPSTGKATRSNMLSATVIAENCMLADGYATAFMALGFERSSEMLKEVQGISVYFIYSDENGENKTYVSPGTENKLVD
ncbi:FAD:protein FMN transferase [Gramella sp. GC03-9]|uniref:FAD:protein FMN transferase n=1 Tax=Christiangramia oceanisediminis TaxID=2920386 RepID=A0A9X2I324_9FLAO|nr:FAD:protein FMN transferase [Gramella oceanisediminis]MCP9198437.1 FAD:protein FMN transferase [Gramella oceanisediminis]